MYEGEKESIKVRKRERKREKESEYEIESVFVRESERVWEREVRDREGKSK